MSASQDSAEAEANTKAEATASEPQPRRVPGYWEQLSIDHLASRGVQLTRY